jgi:hypothetical protein
LLEVPLRRRHEMGESGIEDLIGFWRDFDANGRKPCVHRADLGAMKDQRTKQTDLDMSSDSRFFELTTPEQKICFHLSLSPVPYMGNLRSADIFLLMINPSAGYTAYCTNADPAFRQALARTLKQDFKEGENACLALNPQHCGSGWSCYHEQLLGPILSEYATDSGAGAHLNYRQALGELSRRVAILELVPYYSACADQITNRFLRDLTSAQKARKAAQDLRKKAQECDATVMVRGANMWGLGDAGKIIRLPRRGLNREAKDAILKRLRARRPPPGPQSVNKSP